MGFRRSSESRWIVWGGWVGKVLFSVFCMSRSCRWQIGGRDSSEGAEAEDGSSVLVSHLGESEGEEEREYVGGLGIWKSVIAIWSIELASCALLRVFIKRFN